MSNETSQFIELMGRQSENDGMPRIAGRLLGALLVADGPSSLDDLTEKLQVSKGSVSSNARLLEQFGMVQRVTVPGDRRDYYEIASDLPVRLVEFTLSRLNGLACCLRRGREAVQPSSDRVRDRITDLLAFLEEGVQIHQERLERFRAERPHAGAGVPRRD